MHDANDSNSESNAPKRIRASKRALEIAIEVLQAQGVPIRKIVVSGGRFEIYSDASEDTVSSDDEDGLKNWDGLQQI